MLHELLHCKKRLQPKRFTILTPTPVLSKDFRLVTVYEYFCYTCYKSGKDGVLLAYAGTKHDGSEGALQSIRPKDVDYWLTYVAIGRELEKQGAHMVQRSNPVFPYQKQNVAVK